jgi:hypothetical protein
MSWRWLTVCEFRSHHLLRRNGYHLGVCCKRWSHYLLSCNKVIHPYLEIFFFSDYANLRFLRTTKELNGYQTRLAVKRKQRSAVIRPHPHRPGRRMPQMRLVVDPRERALYTMLLALREKYVGASCELRSHYLLCRNGWHVGVCCKRWSLHLLSCNEY